MAQTLRRARGTRETSCRKVQCMEDPFFFISPIVSDCRGRLSRRQAAEVSEVLHILLQAPPLLRAVVGVEGVQKHLEAAPIVHPERALFSFFGR